MNHSGPNSIGDGSGTTAGQAAACGGTDVADLARQLRMIAQHLATFLEGQYERLDSAARQCEEILGQRDQLHRAQSEFQSQREEWKAERSKREGEIRQEQDRLIAAWKTLESEQRRLLATGAPAAAMAVHAQPPPLPAPQAGSAPAPPSQPAPHPQPEPAQPIPPTNGTPLTIPAADAPAAPEPAVSPPATANPVVELPPAEPPAKQMSREAAMDQFQRLKRDIRSHSQRYQRNHKD